MSSIWWFEYFLRCLSQFSIFQVLLIEVPFRSRLVIIILRYGRTKQFGKTNMGKCIFEEHTHMFEQMTTHVRQEDVYELTTTTSVCQVSKETKLVLEGPWNDFSKSKRMSENLCFNKPRALVNLFYLFDPGVCQFSCNNLVNSRCIIWGLQGMFLSGYKPES